MLLRLFGLDSMKYKNFPRQDTASVPSLSRVSSSPDVPTWNLRSDTNNWQAIPHSADAAYTWDDPKVQYPDVSHVYHGYLASFAISRDPKKHRCTGVQEWHRYEAAKDRAPAARVESDTIWREECFLLQAP